MEARLFALGRRRRTEHLARGRLIEAAPDARFADALQKPERPVSRDIRGVLRDFEAHPHVALRGEVVHLVRTNLVQQFPEAAGVGHIREMEAETAPVLVEVRVNSVQAVGVEAARASFDTVDFIALLQQKFGEVGAVLAGDAGDERTFHVVFRWTWRRGDKPLFGRRNPVASLGFPNQYNTDDSSSLVGYPSSAGSIYDGQSPTARQPPAPILPRGGFCPAPLFLRAYTADNVCGDHTNDSRNRTGPAGVRDGDGSMGRATAWHFLSICCGSWGGGPPPLSPLSL